MKMSERVEDHLKNLKIKKIKKKTIKHGMNTSWKLLFL
ncbi:hypothetical protein SAMN04488588_1407 [Geotoga petraea]|uniref:Uncharacterized protein n=1 Tax=Geotoga petraea TaxID=28234 RepID=A0A1G6MXI1_9BACT|nr:hypothetical protein SAMN04488588_1407 [Geotoga petraea]